MRGETINANINCDQAYSLTANSTSRSFTLDEQVYNGTIATPPTFKFVGLDSNGDGIANLLDANEDGIIDGAGIEVNCNTPFPDKSWIIMDPPQGERTYTFSENPVSAPQGWDIIPPNLVWYGADCTDAGTTVSPQIIAVSQGIQKNLTVRYNVTQ